MPSPRSRRWYPLALAFAVGAMPALAQTAVSGPAAPLRLYAGLNKSKGYVVGAKLSASGLHRFEGDTTWTHLGWSNPRISGVTADPADRSRVYLAAGNGVMVSRDGGRAWRIPTDWRVTEVQDVAAEPGRGYAGSAYGVWRSDDGGGTWVESNAGIPEMKRYTQDIEVDASTPLRVLAATDGGVYVSTDGARSWRRAGPDVTVNDVTQSASDPRVWYAGTRERGLMRSGDGGETWQSVAPRFNTTTFFSISVDPRDGRRVAAASWGHGVVVSTDGGRTWAARTRGLPSANVYAVIYDANRPGRLWAATVEAGIFTSDDAGRTWRYAGMNGTLVFDFAFLPDFP